jgi:hypothetical protein
MKYTQYALTAIIICIILALGGLGFVVSKNAAINSNKIQYEELEHQSIEPETHPILQVSPTELTPAFNISSGQEDQDQSGFM